MMPPLSSPLLSSPPHHPLHLVLDKPGGGESEDQDAEESEQAASGSEEHRKVQGR